VSLQLPPLLEAAIEAFFTPEHIAANDIQQHEWEMRSLLKLMLDVLKPERTVELGTYKGFTAALLSLATSEKTISLDITDYGTDYAKQYARNLQLFLTDAAIDGVEQVIGNHLGGPIDLLYIDDGHYYETIVKEFALWSPMVRSGGWIVFHDINPLANIGPHGTQPDSIQVPRFWKELNGDKTELIANAQNKYRGHLPHGGIGILKV